MGARAQQVKDTFFAKAKEWHWIITVGLGVMLVMGFGFETPSSRIQKLDTRIDSTNTHIDTLEAHMAHSERVLLREIRRTQWSIEKLMIGECLDRPRRETQLQGLPCNALLNQARRDHTATSENP